MTTGDHDIDLRAYLNRIGYDGPMEPTLPVLESVMAKHMANIPFEGIDVLLGRGVDLRPGAVDTKLLGLRRGGYCFEHASLMRRALSALGFSVKQHLARVWVNGNPERDEPRPATHTSLQVHADSRCWLVDVGFGSFMPNTPLAWHLSSPQQTAFGTYRLLESRGGRLLESFHQQQWLPLYEILDFNWQEADFEVANHYTATHPDSRFRNALVLALTMEQTRITLDGNRFKRIGADGSHEQEWLDAEGLAEVLGGRFGLPVADDWRPLLQRVAASNSRI